MIKYETWGEMEYLPILPANILFSRFLPPTIWGRAVFTGETTLQGVYLFNLPPDIPGPRSGPQHIATVVSIQLAGV